MQNLMESLVKLAKFFPQMLSIQSYWALKEVGKNISICKIGVETHHKRHAAVIAAKCDSANQLVVNS